MKVDGLDPANLVEDSQGVGADEQVLERFEPVHGVPRADSANPLVGFDRYESRGKRRAWNRIPRRGERRIQRKTHPGQPNSDDFHESDLGGEERIGRRIASRKHVLDGGKAGSAAAQRPKSGLAIIAVDELRIVGSRVDPYRRNHDVRV